MDIFNYMSYKEYLTDFISSNAHVKGLQTRLSKAAGCHGSYLSSVLHDKIQLTPDHAFGMKTLLGLSSVEFEYFFTLVLYERSVTKELQAELKGKLIDLKKTKENLKLALSGKEGNKDFEIKYYSQWFWAAIHMATYSEEYRTPEAISKRLDIPINKVKDILEELQKALLVKQVKGKWINHEDPGYLEKASSMNFTNHFNWRNRALADIEKDKPDSLHYSSVMVIDRKDAERIKSQIVKLLADQRKTIAESGSEELYSFSCDFFQV